MQGSRPPTRFWPLTPGSIPHLGKRILANGAAREAGQRLPGR